MSKKKRNDFICGYACATATMIRMQGRPNSETRELFGAGMRNMSVKDLRDAGVDEYDLELFIEHWQDLNR